MITIEESPFSTNTIYGGVYSEELVDYPFSLHVIATENSEDQQYVTWVDKTPPMDSQIEEMIINKFNDGK